MPFFGVPFFGVPFFEQKINVGGIIFAKITSSHKFLGVILENNSLGH